VYRLPNAIAAIFPTDRTGPYLALSLPRATLGLYLLLSLAFAFHSNYVPAIYLLDPGSISICIPGFFFASQNDDYIYRHNRARAR
jgi:hypothetical protein